MRWFLLPCLLVTPAVAQQFPSFNYSPGGGVVQPSQGTWTILNPGNPVYTDANGKSYFNFPYAAPGVNYLTTPTSGISARSTGMRMAYTITTTGAPVFDYRTNPNNTCGPGYPGTVRLFIQRRGDNLSGAGVFQQYRYWSQEGWRELGPGSFLIIAAFDPAKWTDVYGKPGSAYPDRFQAALRNAGNIGVTFGGGCFYGHGVFVDPGTGSAQFRIDGFGVQ